MYSNCVCKNWITGQLSSSMILGHSVIRGQEDCWLTSTAKGSPRTWQWAQGQPSVSMSSMDQQLPLHIENKVHSRDGEVLKCCCVLIRNTMPYLRMMNGLVYRGCVTLSSPPGYIHSSSPPSCQSKSYGPEGSSQGRQQTGFTVLLS